MGLSKKFLLIFGGVVAIIFLDYITKFLVATKMQLGESITLIQNIFHITYVHNYGAGFGILQGQRMLLMLIAVIVIGLIVYYYRKIPEIKYVQISAMFLLGGTIANFVERAWSGYVIDFIQISIWPKFNVADSAIVLGGLGLAYYFWKEDGKKK